MFPPLLKLIEVSALRRSTLDVCLGGQRSRRKSCCRARTAQNVKHFHLNPSGNGLQNEKAMVVFRPWLLISCQTGSTAE